MQLGERSQSAVERLRSANGADYELRLFAVPFRWRTVAGGTLMHDRVEYEVPPSGSFPRDRPPRRRGT